MDEITMKIKAMISKFLVGLFALTLSLASSAEPTEKPKDDTVGPDTSQAEPDCHEIPVASLIRDLAR